MDYNQMAHSESAELDGKVVSDHLPRTKPVSPARRLGYLIFALCFLIGLVLLPSLAQRITHAMSRGVEMAKREEAMELLADLPSPNDRIPWIVKKVAPSVVGIRTNVQKQGTGIIVDDHGHILTNLHVVRDEDATAARINVQLSDGRQTDGARVVGFDEKLDLALLTIDLFDAIPIVWGRSESLEVGETVVAIGNPYGLDHSVSAGIVSAKHRYKMTSDGVVVQEFLQTDAAINPGSSGGPLVDIRGDLVGINTEILGESYQGISFAVPSDAAREFFDRIVLKK